MRFGLSQNFSKDSKSNRKTNPDDLTLWRSIRNGNDLAFSSLYNRYANLLFNYGMHVSSNRELVKDCIQELFTNIWNRKESLSEIESVKYYLLKSFRNQIFRNIEKDRKFFVDFEDSHERFQSDKFVEEEMIEQEIISRRKEQMNLALSRISKRQREIVVLKYFNELNYSQISSLMGISIPSAHNLISKALQSLISELEKSKK